MIALQKRRIIGNTFGWAIAFPLALIATVKLDDFYEGYINPDEESLFLALAFILMISVCQSFALQSVSHFKWILGSLVGALVAHIAIDTYSFYLNVDGYLASPIYSDLIGCIGLDVPPKWFPGLTGCYGIFPPVSAAFLGLFVSLGQMWAAKFTYRWTVANTLIFLLISTIILLFSMLRLFDLNIDIFLIGWILGIVYAYGTKSRLAKELRTSYENSI
jgi:hypothetical protein